MESAKHSLCLLSGANHPLSSGFFNDLSLDPDDAEIFRFDDANCDCSCTTCKEVGDGKVLFLYRYLPQGKEVVKVTRV